jgi:neutral trehalase
MVLALDGWLRLHNIQTRDMVYLLLIEIAVFSAPLGLLAIMTRRWLGREPHWTMPGTWASAAVILVYVLVRKEHLQVATAIHAGWIFYGVVSLVAMSFFVFSDFRAVSDSASKQTD